MISFQNVSFTYAESGDGGVVDLNLIIRSGECVLLCGPSGCGKTTVTRLANGLIPHFFHGNLSGQVNVNGMDTRETEIAALSDAVGTVFQNPRTQFFNTDTDSEIVFGLENRGIPREALRSRLDELTEELHLSELRGRNIFELSGGEKQKIAFSSVYASAPDVLVFDEPSSNLDMKAIGELADLIQRAKISGKTILIAEHRIWYLMDIVDRVVYMQDGRIASDMEASAFKALPEADIRRMGLRVRDLSVSESGGVKTIAADGLLSAQKISVRLGGRNVLNDISFQAGRGEIIAIAGVNGAGKSTLARMLCGLQKNGSGTVLWAGKPMSRRLRRKKAYMVMQDVGHQLFTDSVAAECALGIKAPNKDEIDRTLEKVDLLAYTGFDLGADDYIPKPFRPRELISRIRNVLRLTGSMGKTVKLGDVVVDTEKGTAVKNNRDLFLSALEYRLLLFFINNRGIVLTRERLLDAIWDVAGEYVNDNTLTVYIKRLREKIEDDPADPKIILTVRGTGYKVDA